MDENKDKILGFYAACQHDYQETDEEASYRDTQYERLSEYLWGSDGLDSKLRSLKFQEYGNDIKLFLFEFQAFPSEEVAQHYKDIQSYRPKERSIGASIIVNRENFFDKSEAEQHKFLRNVIANRLDLLAEVVKRKRLDTDVSRLIRDVQIALDLEDANGQQAGANPSVFKHLKQKLGNMSVPPEEPALAEEDVLKVTITFLSGKAFGTDSEKKQMYQFEDMLDSAVEKADGDLDGHDIGEGKYTIYIYGSDPDRLVTVVKPMLAMVSGHEVELTKRSAGVEEQVTI